MPEYRFYHLDSDGRIQGPSVVADCHDDEDAKALAFCSLSTGGETEVWFGSRLLGRVSPGHTKPAS